MRSGFLVRNAKWLYRIHREIPRSVSPPSHYSPGRHSLHSRIHNQSCRKSRWTTGLINLFIHSFSTDALISGVIYATVYHRSLQTVQNIFIVNLAIADVIVCLLSIPLTPVTTIAKQWYFGSTLCRAVGGIQAIGIFIGTFSLCAIAIDRYFRLVIAPGKDFFAANVKFMDSWIFANEVWKSWNHKKEPKK